MGSDKLSAAGITAYHQKICFEAETLFARKNADYARSSDSPLSNFELPEYFGIATKEDAIFIRFCDKVSRIANLMQRDARVSDESFRDTAVDAINYIVLLAALKENNDG